MVESSYADEMKRPMVGGNFSPMRSEPMSTNTVSSLVSEALVHLDQMIQVLAEEVSRTEQRLRPVLSPVGPEKDSNFGKEQVASSDLVNALQDKAYVLEAILTKLRSINNRIEL